MSYVGDLQNPIYKRQLKKTSVKLKKDIKANWGRFLDNHYDPNLHLKPFNAAMNFKGDSYKYSSAGLSHKFINSGVLQAYDMEDKPDRKDQTMRFKEITEMTEGDVFVFIEYWTNDENKQLSTNHSEKKYISYAKRFRQAIIEKFPQVKVYIKSTVNSTKIVKYHTSKDPKGNIIDEQREPLRIGAFEISVSTRKDSFTRHTLIYSKLKTNCFPNLPNILSKVCEFVPKCNLIVNIWDNIQNINDKPKPERSEGMIVQLKWCFKNTQASLQLHQDIFTIENDRFKTPQK